MSAPGNYYSREGGQRSRLGVSGVLANVTHLCVTGVTKPVLVALSWEGI